MSELPSVGPELPSVGPELPSVWPALDASGRVKPLVVYEAEVFRFALAHHHGNITAAACALRIGKATLYRKMKAHGIPPVPLAERAIQRGRAKAR